MKKSLFKAGMTGGWAIALSLSLASCNLPTNPSQTPPGPEAVVSTPASATPAAEQTTAKPTAPKTPQPEASVAEPEPRFVVPPPPFEVVPSVAKEAAATLTDAPLLLAVQSYSRDELLAAGGGGCGMSLWRADGSYGDSLVLFSGIGEGPQLLMKLEGQFVILERMEGSGQEFYGQFAQQRFRNLNGDIEVMTEVELGAEGEIESVAIDRGRVVVTKNSVSQEIAVKGDAGC